MHHGAVAGVGEINGIGRLRSNTFTILAGCYAQKCRESIPPPNKEKSRKRFSPG
jgi:hypothetical protein